MRYISKQYEYDDTFLEKKIPAEAMLAICDTEHDIPIFVDETALSDVQCDKIIEAFLENGPSGRSYAEKARDNIVRKSHHFDLTGTNRSTYCAAIQRVRDKIGAYYSVILGDSDGAHGLGYGVGCKYSLHADNCDPVLDETGNVLHFEIKFPRRQISTILFLTDSVDEITAKYQHVGGNLSFDLLRDQNNNPLLIEPKKGHLVAFPSHPIYSQEVHEVYEVSDGYRFVIVDWFDAKRDNNPRVLSSICKCARQNLQPHAK